ncbi:ras-interacting protein RIP3 [Musca vetustissima]|uniref:ras-interacting protein RIP3 n=1 Tax=Musca vetustissima TaxID=27455 RepID=UPI002AB66BF4|nr:ras-interacting protein RIP3 [Musca vetustissima]
MPIQLDKILADIANEVVLHPNYQGATKKEIDDAWARVGKNSNLSVHESRSIFKVLQKKYDQEKLKETSAWKLFAVMDKIHKKVEAKPEPSPAKEEESSAAMEEDEQYEMLEVQEEEDGGGEQHGQHSGESGSEAESPNKSSQSYGTSPDKQEEQKPQINLKNAPKQQTTPTTTSSSPGSENIRPNSGAAKLLNSMATVNSAKPNIATTPTSVTAAALQKKGITMKKTSIGSQGNQQQGRSIIKTQQGRTAANAGAMHGLEVGKTIQLPESLKRKLSTEPSTPQNKRVNQQHTPQSNKGSPSSASAKSSPQAQQQQQHTTTAQLLQLKQECQEQQQRQQNSGATPTGINVITIPANPTGNLVNGIINTNAGTGGPSSSTAATVASTTSTNGFSPRIEDIDFRNDIIFDSNNAVNGGGSAIPAGKVQNASEIINLGNFDNSLPPTFFKNLCNSSRHEALGLYVANVMNRLRPRSAAKLEVGILRAILDVQSDELDQ